MSTTSEEHSGVGVGSGGNDISPAAFYSLTWIFFALCTIAFAARVYIRFVCFRRLMFEDYLMLLALAMHNVEVVLIQVYAKYAFDMEAVQRGDLSRMTPEFMPNNHKAFVALGICVNMSMVGIVIVKLTFLLFFRRIVVHTGRGFNMIWWGVALFTIAGAVAQLAMMEYRCIYGPIEQIVNSEACNGPYIRWLMITSIFSAVQDAVSDLLIIGFPVAILWRSGIGMRKKLILSFVFGMVSFTIAITIVRGSVFSKVYNHLHQSASFTWFWFYTEFSVAIIIACVVSFRTLFVNRDQKAKNRIQENERRQAFLESKLRRKWQHKVRQLHNSVLDTCRDLEGSDWPGGRFETFAVDVPSGLMTVDFSEDSNWTRNVTTAKTNDGNNSVSIEHSVSMQSLLRNQIKIPPTPPEQVVKSDLTRSRVF